jgi:hypothetical protein
MSRPDEDAAAVDGPRRRSRGITGPDKGAAV